VSRDPAALRPLWIHVVADKAEESRSYWMYLGFLQRGNTDRDRFLLIGMAAAPEPGERTRVALTGGVRVPGRES
jgi:hypothetical protein